MEGDMGVDSPNDSYDGPIKEAETHDEPSPYVTGSSSRKRIGRPSRGNYRGSFEMNREERLSRRRGQAQSSSRDIPEGSGLGLPSGDRSFERFVEMMMNSMNRSETLTINWLKMYRDLHPPSFKGDSEVDPSLKEYWMEQTEKLLEHLECPEEHWYEAKFSKLIKYVPMYTTDDLEKAQKFFQGLRKEVKQVLYAWNIRTFEDAVEKAITVERNMMAQGELKLHSDSKKEVESKDKSTNPPTVQFKKPEGAKFKRERYCKKCKKRHAGNKCGTKGKEAGCFVCGETRHFTRDYLSRKTLKIKEAPRKEVTCYACKQRGHYSWNCPQRGKTDQGKKLEGKSSPLPARVFHLTKAEVEIDPSVVEGTLFIHTTPVHPLVDPGATHSFIANESTRSLNLKSSSIGHGVMIQSPIGETMETNLIFQNCDVDIEGEKFKIDLILMEMQDFDVILSMDFLSRYCASMDCLGKTVELGCAG
ncbi:uncharacterized protein LOC127804546 [Diospyros lotus]|uniref:uncharacterized protein LOC127804546 n=1 Tax=Diospyros lotus TaxID=55363 RepID=UPI00224DBEC6|nr:uncharacterized protein LOC127804546 [Diospyros lotus]